MGELLSSIDTFITTLLNSLGMYGPILGSVLILFESILPILPLSVFITLNFYAFGNVLGFFISYILTCIGCNMAFFLSSKVFSNRMKYLNKRFGENKILKLINTFSNIKFKNLVMIMAFPFTPAFMVNILSGVSKMNYNKFLIASLVGKPFMVYFWGYVGVTLIQSFTHPEYFVKIIVLMLIAYIVSTFVNKKFELD